jgi:uncharacterized protein
MADPIRLKPKRPCPICRKPSAQATHPFCSARCAQVDLGRWMQGSYAIPAEDDNPPPTDDSEA